MFVFLTFVLLWTFTTPWKTAEQLLWPISTQRNVNYTLDANSLSLHLFGCKLYWNVDYRARDYRSKCRIMVTFSGADCREKHWTKCNNQRRLKGSWMKRRTKRTMCVGIKKNYTITGLLSWAGAHWAMCSVTYLILWFPKGLLQKWTLVCWGQVGLNDICIFIHMFFWGGQSKSSSFCVRFSPAWLTTSHAQV